MSTRKDDVNNVLRAGKMPAIDYVVAGIRRALMMQGQKSGCACIDKFCYTGRKVARVEAYLKRRT